MANLALGRTQVEIKFSSIIEIFEAEEVIRNSFLFSSYRKLGDDKKNYYFHLVTLFTRRKKKEMSFWLSCKIHLYL